MKSIKITESLIESAYQIARRYYEADGKIRITDARNELVKLGLNKNSAVDMIYGFKHMLDGERYTRNLSEKATATYLRCIQRDYDISKLQNAVSALRQHIEYYQTLTDTPMSGQVCILAQYEKITGVTDGFFISPEEVSFSDPLKEGRTKSVLVNIYERNPKARKLCIEFYGLICSVCEFDFEKKYGALGRGFIHVHHLRDLALIEKEYEIDPIKDLRPVCPNCHAMLHKSKPAYPIEELKAFIKPRK